MLVGRMRQLSWSGVTAHASVAVLGALASLTSLVNGFVYDDRPIILTNPRVHTLARWWQVFAQPYWPPDWGDTNYRPLTILSFAAQWAIGRGSPVVFHATSVLLYVAVCLAVFRLARLLLPAPAAWLVASLFAVHPVHVEAVGNVVGQAELTVAICAVLAVTAYLRLRAFPAGLPRRATGPRDGAKAAAPIVVAYVVGCLAKETGFFIAGLLVAAELSVVGARLEPERRSFRARARDLWPLYAMCALVAAAYLAARRAVLGGFGDDPNTVIALLGHKARLLTMLGVVPEWARLLIWPARLAVDYSPADVAVVMGFAPVVLPGLVILVGCIAICAAAWRGPRTASFGLLWAAVAIFPVSNVFVRSGVIVAERTLFLPSVGAMLALGAAAVWAARRTADWGIALRRVAPLPVAALLALGVLRSASRQRVWRSAEDFFAHILEDAPQGYRAHYMYGMWNFENGRLEEGERHVRMAIALFPYDAAPYTDLAEQYRKARLCAPARPLYRRAIALGESRGRARLGLVACLLEDAFFAEASAQARRGIASHNPEVPEFRRLLAIADSAQAATIRVRQSGNASDP